LKSRSEETREACKVGRSLWWVLLLQLVDDGETAEGENPIDASVSWTDRKKRDRIREKDLLAKAK
jgi:hypothetical protein